jgi:hypothetical protein
MLLDYKEQGFTAEARSSQRFFILSPLGALRASAVGLSEFLVQR